MKRTARPRPARRRGAIMVLIAVLIPVFAMMAAIAIDISFMQLVRTELRTATDAAARAGAKELSLSQDIDTARAAALDAASRNLVAGEPLLLSPGDVEFGVSEQSGPNTRFAFSPGGDPINGVRATGRRTAGSRSGPVNLFLGSMMGVDTFEPVYSATSTVLDRDICLVIDRSGSMGLDISFSGTGNGQNCGPLTTRTRFFALAQAIEAFLGELNRTFPEERVALASYSSDVSRNCSGGDFQYDVADLREELTTDYARITSEMNDFLTRGIGGRTAIGEGLREGIRALRNPRPFAIKTIVLMTDGRHNLGVEPAVVARDAAAANITVHTVTFSPNADFTRMRDVADRTGGQHFHADTAVDLAIVFREIARTLPVLITN